MSGFYHSYINRACFIFFTGKSAQCPEGSFDFSGITVDDIERIEIVKGPQSTIYGSEAMAGVINIITKKGSDKIHADLILEGGSFGTHKASASVSGSSKILDYRVTTSYLKTDGISTAKEGDEKDGYENASLSTKLGIKPSDIFNLEFTGRYSYDRTELDDYSYLQRALVDALNYVQHGHHYVLSGKANLYLFDIWEQVLTASKSKDTARYRDPDTSSNNYDLITSIDTVDWQHNLYLFDNYILTAGAEYREEKGENEGLFDRTTDNKAFYINNQIKLLEENLNLNAGLRLDDNESFGSHDTYRIGAVYNFRTIGLRARASYGTGFRAPTFNELFYPNYGNLSLEPEESEAWEAGIEKDLLEDRLILSLTYFEQSYKNLIQTEFSKESFDAFKEKISHISGIELNKLEKNVLENTADAKQMVRKTYFNAVFYIKGAINRAKSGDDVDIKKAKRVITSVVNTIIEHEQTLLGMTTIKDYDEYTYFHCTNVSILSVALGQRLGLDRKMLIDLGIASLFHDLGKIEVPYEILNKPVGLLDAEWRIIQKHPVWGVKAILKMRGMDELTIRAALVAFEHHMNLNHSGYPRLKTPFELDLFSKIVSIADRYDAMTSARVYSRTPILADKALSILMDQSGNKLDPLLLKFFICMVGIYPIGTLVKLDSNELGLIFDNNQQYLFRPRVMLITDTKGNWTEGHVVDLTEKNDVDEYKRTITKTMDRKKYGINISEYLL